MATQSETEPEPGGNGMADPFCADSLCRGGGVAANMYLSTSASSKGREEKAKGRRQLNSTKDAEREAESAKLSEMLQNPLIGMIRARHSRNPKLKKKSPREFHKNGPWALAI